MKSRDSHLPFVYLKPGEVCMTGKPTKVSTVLGSCVSVTMYVPSIRFGAICHGLLPECICKNCANCNERLKYIDCSVKYMLERIDRIGIDKNEIEVKVFGGGDVLPYFGNATGRITVGSQNIEAAMKILKQLGLTPKNTDLGGVNGRKLFFYTHTGEVLLKKIRKTIISDEQYGSKA
ncbi:MAG: chemotaxis protein CheD [Nitrospirae bacterium]|nr:chemotaxis protein CheD [Nitrospirota bacterium]